MVQTVSAIGFIKNLNERARGRGGIETIPQFDNIATQAQYRIPYEITRRYVHAGDRVLEWGCGNGHFSLFLESLGANVTGYSFEPPPRVMERAAQFEFVPGTDGDPRLLPFAGAEFDAVVGVGVLEHVWELGGDEHASLRELARVLKPGGVLLTYHLPNKSGWVEKVVGGLKLNKHFHKRKYDSAEVRRLWTEAGLEVIDLGLYNSLPRAELRLFPRVVKQSSIFTVVYDGADAAVTAVAPRLCTNFFVVARKPSTRPAEST